MTITRTAGLSLAGAIVGLWACGGAQAETFKTTSGRAIYVPVSTEATKQADGSTVLRMSTTGISTADLPFPFDFEKHQCNATAHIAADGKSGRTYGYCEILSSKGDRAAFTYVGDLTGGRWTMVEGTGADAYAGAKGGGTYKVKYTMPTGELVSDWDGTWQTD